VLEEFVLTILYIPHLIALPAKVVSWLLAKTSIDSYFTNTRLVRQEFQLYVFDIDRNRLVDIEPSIQQLVTNYGSMADFVSDFYHVQLLFLSQAVMLGYGLVEAINFVLLKVEFTMKKLLSGLRYVPLASINLGMQLIRPRYLWLLQILQVLFFFLTIIYRASFIVVPIYLNFVYSDYTWFGCLFGPAFVNLVFYVTFYFNISTVAFYQNHFPLYRPVATVRSFCFQMVYQPYRFIVGGVKLSLKAFRYAVMTPLKFLLGLVSQTSIGIVKSYEQVLYISGRVLKPLRILGDLLFIPVTLIWMWWPLVVSYFAGELWLWLPSIVLSAFLTVKGYSVANRAWA
jgi:hypothetical protein